MRPRHRRAAGPLRSLSLERSAPERATCAGRRATEGDGLRHPRLRELRRTVNPSCGAESLDTPIFRLRPSEPPDSPARSEEHTSELQSLMRISYAVFCLKKKKN